MAVTDQSLTAADQRLRASVARESARCLDGLDDGGDGRSGYDSVVIVGGAGVTGHTFAGRLARSRQFAGRVVLAGPAAEESRRLTAGMSLPGSVADAICYALDVPFDTLVDRISGGARPAPIARPQPACMAQRPEGEGWTFTKPGHWLLHADRLDKAAELDALADIVLGVGESMGLQAVGPDETLGRAVVPSIGWRAPAPGPPGAFDLRRAASCGIAAYYADGMTGGGLGGTLAAEAVLHGADPTAATAKALARFRRRRPVRP